MFFFFIFKTKINIARFEVLCLQCFSVAFRRVFLTFVFFLRVVGWNLWNDNVLGWWKHKDDPNVLFLKYEDLHKVMLQFPLQTAELWLVTAMPS